MMILLLLIQVFSFFIFLPTETILDNHSLEVVAVFK